MRVKIIQEHSNVALEDAVNKFLQTIDKDQIIGIQYQGVGNRPSNRVDRVSVMIILRQ